MVPWQRSGASTPARGLGPRRRRGKGERVFEEIRAEIFFPEIMRCQFTNPRSSENRKRHTSEVGATRTATWVCQQPNSENQRGRGKEKAWSRAEKRCLRGTRTSHGGLLPETREARRRGAGGDGGRDRLPGILYPAKVSFNHKVDKKTFFREKEAGRIHYAMRNVQVLQPKGCNGQFWLHTKKRKYL